MNKHPSAVLLQALEDGEVGMRRRASLLGHVEACARCRDTLSELRELSRNFSGALSRLDRAGEPALARLATAGPAVQPAVGVRSVPDRPWLRAAAIVALLIGASSVAGLSAVWLRDRLASEDGAIAASPTAATPEPSYRSGFTVTPTAPALRVELAGLSADSRVRLIVVDEGDVSIDVAAADAPVRFSDQRAGRIDVTVNGRADVTVALPRSLDAATLVIDGVVRASSRNGRIEIAPVAGGVTVVPGDG